MLIPLFKQEDQWIRINEQRTDDGALAIRIAKVRAGGFIFRNFKGYILSSIGSRLVPVDRLAGWQTKM